jgi:hypothetical protein
MNREIVGRVIERESGAGVEGVVVLAFDKDWVFDDPLGEVRTGPGGAFRLVYADKAFRGVLDAAPDIYLVVRTDSGRPLIDTKNAVRANAGASERFDLRVPADALRAAGVPAGAQSPLPAIAPAKLKTLACIARAAASDDLARQIANDLDAATSVLEMFRDWTAELRGALDNNALPLRKLACLFALGATPERVEGNFYGFTPGLRTGNLDGVAAEFGNVLGWVWGETLGDVCPWVGKAMTSMAPEDRRRVAGDSIPEATLAFNGINHFHAIEGAALNQAATALLTFLWHLQDAPPEERRRYGYERVGGHFVAHRAPSVFAGTPRDVFRLNYRYPELRNPPPLAYLIDELVEISDGLYLGQLLLASRRLLERYDAGAADARHHYQHVGYFLLFDESWNVEARRLFPNLGMPSAAVVTSLPRPAPQAPTPPKFTTLTLADPPDGNADPAALGQVRRDLETAGTVIRLIQSYADALRDDPDTASPVFGKLQALYNAGIGTGGVDGFYRGALVTWQSQGLLAAFQTNAINVAWQAARCFSPWTGKRFDPLSAEHLARLTDGQERMDGPAWFGSNTVAFRTAKERLTRAAMQLAGAWIEDATAEERRAYGYDAKTFHFICKRAPSIAPENRGKPVLQFNYRWKALRNIPPDRWCIDELVQIAEGFYLGQVYYATNILEPWDPKTPLETYRYRLFEYFVLMDEEWHARRLRIGYDLDNV